MCNAKGQPSQVNSNGGVMCNAKGQPSQVNSNGGLKACRSDQHMQGIQLMVGKQKYYPFLIKHILAICSATIKSCFLGKRTNLARLPSLRQMVPIC